MKLNTFADLCLRIVVSLAETAPQTGRQLAESVGLPYNHVSKAVIRLRDLGLVEVARGRSGGASLTDAGRRATVGGILRELDSREDVAECTRDGEAVCPLYGRCGLRGVLNRARERFYAELDDVVVAGLASRPPHRGPGPRRGSTASLGFPGIGPPGAG
ncbi:RrF2 family transcriptional regulator [Arthrobacter sp. UM1]|uniref:RrF2 family transcriptional regulator n=1 Tax=Arthrobacter sp. UM1 TaxID=2766776 RepID=UPI001CF6715A|nr:Rrf2 family transcriptional regulator [Arthrobacter sp. UM1]MCB4209075.1 Rrf2 family transcriptional regulator [Arthrobacter sp. UM1]